MKVNRWYWLRAVILILAFAGSVYAIRNLDQTRKSQRGASVNLCPTRVKEISVAGGMKLVQDGMAWYRKAGGRMEELDPIAVEKWFGRHCVVAADAAETPTGAGAELATLAFVSGPPQVLFGTSAGVFTWMNQAFTSAELADALKSLSELPIRLRSSR
jgi:hypothetical protein